MNDIETMLRDIPSRRMSIDATTVMTRARATRRRRRAAVAGGVLAALVAVAGGTVALLGRSDSAVPATISHDAPQSPLFGANGRYNTQIPWSADAGTIDGSPGMYSVREEGGRLHVVRRSGTRWVDIPTTTARPGGLIVASDTGGRRVVAVPVPPDAMAVTVRVPGAYVHPGIGVVAPNKALAALTFLPKTVSGAVESAAWTLPAPGRTAGQAAPAGSLADNLGEQPTYGTVADVRFAVLSKSGQWLATSGSISVQATVDDPLTFASGEPVAGRGIRLIGVQLLPSGAHQVSSDCPAFRTSSGIVGRNVAVVLTGNGQGSNPSCSLRWTDKDGRPQTTKP